MIGAIFGAFFNRSVPQFGAGVLWGLGYGVIWWVAGALIAMPVFLGMPAFAPLQMTEMRPSAWGSLMGHAVYGMLLGALLVRLTWPVAHGTAARGA